MLERFRNLLLSTYIPNVQYYLKILKQSSENLP